MKKFILILFFLLGTLSYAQTQQSFPLGKYGGQSTGCFYNGATYLMYPDPWGQSKIYYDKIYLGDSDAISSVSDSTDYYKMPFSIVPDLALRPTSCVFNGRLYLFFANGNRQLMYTSTDGSTWTDPVKVFGGYIAWGASMSASVLDNKLYLAFEDKNNNITMIYTSDLQTWSSAGNILSAGDVSNNHAYISTCTFAKSNNTSHLLIAVDDNDASIYTTVYDENQGFHNSKILAVVNESKSGVKLAQGSLFGNFQTNANASVQLFFRGGNTKLMSIMQYTPDDNSWGSPIETTYLNDITHTYPPLNAFTLFRSVNEKEAVQRICVLQASNTASPNTMEVLVFNSDIIKLIADSTIVNTCDSLPSLWSLIGVVEGPPPFVLNGNKLSDLISSGLCPSEFIYGTTKSEEVVNSSEWTVSASASVSVPFAGIFSAGIDIKTAVNGLVSTGYTKTYEEGRTIQPVDSALGYYFFIKPTITRYKYERFNYNNDYTNQCEYVFTVTDATLMPVPFKLSEFPQDFKPFNIESYVNKAPGPTYKTLFSKEVTCLTGAPVSFTFENSTSTENTQGTKVEIDANVGAEDFFKVSAGYSIDITETHKTTFGKSVSATITIPAAVPGYPDIDSYHATMYWLQSTSKNDYWIPTDVDGHNFSDQRPWLITWSVSDIDTNNTTGVKDKSKLPAEFSLSQNYPNPFNPATTIKYEIPKTSFVRIVVYNLLGETVATLVNNTQKAGNYSTDWNAINLSSGIYFYSIYSKPLDGSKEFSDIKKMILLK